MAKRIYVSLVKTSGDSGINALRESMPVEGRALRSEADALWHSQLPGIRKPRKKKLRRID